MAVAVDDNFRKLGCGYISAQLAKLREHLSRCADSEDIEHVHQARVATRRLRSAMKLFEPAFAPGAARKWRKALKKIAAALGEARDLDVQIQYIELVLGELADPAPQPGLARLELRLRQRRRELDEPVARQVEKVAQQGTLEEIASAAQPWLQEPAPRAGDLASPAVYRLVGCDLLVRIDRLRQAGESMADRHDAPGHHELRKAAKALRYAMEMCLGLYGGLLRPIIRDVKRLQSLLGTCQDCAVWQEQLTQFHRRESDRIQRYYGGAQAPDEMAPGVEYLHRQIDLQWTAALDKAQAHWRRMGSGRAWEVLSEQLARRGGLEAPGAPRLREDRQ